MIHDDLRQLLRKRRQALSPSIRQQYSLHICQQIQEAKLIKKEQKIAIYMPYGSEADMTVLIDYIRAIEASIYLPLLPTEGRILSFSSLTTSGYWQKNRLGIKEWVSPSILDAEALDIVFTPLLGFDKKGHRLGQGGGYYDATFAFLKEKQPLRKTQLFGIGFECQKLESIPLNSWDVSLDGIFTEEAFYRTLRI